MSCGFCTQQKRASDKSCGHCQHGSCGRDVCTYQCTTQPLTPHAEHCTCSSCGLLICQIHHAVHRASMHASGGARPCFPNTSGLFSADALQAGIELLPRESDVGGGPRAPDARDSSQTEDPKGAAIGQFLNVVSPGHTSLASALPALDRSGYWIDYNYWPPDRTGTTSEPGVRFTSAFFDRRTVERVIGLAARVFGRAAAEGFQSPALGGRLNTLKDFASFARTGEIPGDKAIAEWCGEAAPTRQLIPAVRFRLSLEPPDREEDLVYWLADTRTHGQTASV